MKVLIVFASIMVCTTYGFSFSKFFSFAANPCEGITGTKRVPDPDDCTHFYLCDGGASMRMPCRSAEPHFNRCTEKCEVDMDVCNLRTCDTVTTPSATTSGGGATEAPTQAPTTAPSVADTTTRFSPPTVPVGPTSPPTDPGTCTVQTDCNGKCTGCECDQQCTCLADKTCGCDPAITCPAFSCDTCGCPENCDETNAKCFATNQYENCPFDNNTDECITNCGCDTSCTCTSGTTGCTCTGVACM